MPSRYLIKIDFLSFGGVVFPLPTGGQRQLGPPIITVLIAVFLCALQGRLDPRAGGSPGHALVRLNNMVVVFFAALECPVFMGKPELT